MSKLCEGRVVVVTGAGQGIGREHALAFAAEGAKVVVNDIGASLDGSERQGGAAQAVVDEILASGGTAVANTDDIADWAGAESLIQQAVSEFGDLHVVVNNAGILRDRMFVSSTESEWDAVLRVHLKGHVATARHAAAYWRQQTKAGNTVTGRIINTSSGAGLQGSVGQAAYSTAKAGIAALTLVQAAELGSYGVTANAIAPAARTRMTEAVFADMMAKPEGGFDAMDPANVSPLVVWLGSVESADVTGRVFEVQGGQITLSDGWRPGSTVDQQAKWEPAELAPVIKRLISDAPAPLKAYGAR
ncbi:MAG: SDR family oxidoreductase [Myxococcales bacterium]|nr:SDR family oxidoreductase [Myxococcales bacterium]